MTVQLKKILDIKGLTLQQRADRGLDSAMVLGGRIGGDGSSGIKSKYKNGYDKRKDGSPLNGSAPTATKKKRVLKDVDKTNRPSVARTRLASGAKARKVRASLLTSQDKKKTLG